MKDVIDSHIDTANLPTVKDNMILDEFKDI